MEDAVDAVQVERVLDEVEATHVERGGVLLLQLRVVVVRERVDADDLVAGGEQPLGEMGADETGRACDECSHRFATIAYT